jgi:hypothetical protein
LAGLLGSTREGISLRLEFVAIDTLNHPALGNPDLTISNAATAGHHHSHGPRRGYD